MAPRNANPVEKIFKKLIAAAAPDGAIAAGVWAHAVAKMSPADVALLERMLEDDGFFVFQEDEPEQETESEPDFSEEEVDIEVQIAQIAEPYPYFNEQGILTREREFELANIMYHNKRQAIQSALSVRCVENVFSRILQSVMRNNGCAWLYFEDPRDESPADENIMGLIENLVKLVDGLERTGERLSQKSLELEEKRERTERARLQAAIRRLVMQRIDLMDGYLPYPLRNEFFDRLEEAFQEGLEHLRQVRAKKHSYKIDFIKKYGVSPANFDVIARDFARCVFEFQKARENLVLANQRLVIFFARKYQDQGVELADLIGEGNIGLLRAVERFDPAKGSRLATYATWWIKHTLNRAVSCQGATIRIPGHVREEKNRILRVMNEMTLAEGREPSLEDVAARMGMDPARVHAIMVRTQGAVSIDKPLGGDEDEETLQKIIPDMETQTPEDVASRNMDFHWLEELLMELSPRERKILELRYGLHGNETLTLQEVGERLEITRERVRQLQTKAENKIFKLARKLGYK